MKKVDVLFLYETRVRELENICLIKNELESRGYKVGVLNTWNEMGNRKKKYKANVVVSHAMYHDGIFEFVRSFCKSVPKLVNMQCEQIGVMKDKNSLTSRFVLRGDIVKQCMNICWGDETVRRLSEKSRIDSKHIKKTGQVALDFCREELRGYYKTKDEIRKLYNIPEEVEINLFISSFAYVNLPEQIQKESEINDKEEFILKSQESFKGILKWFEQMLMGNGEQAIVYRPHPAEADNEELKRLCEKYKTRFFVISELSVKQWISISDRVYTWYSTAAAEAFMFHVPCAILRPVKIPEYMELELYENAMFIETYEEFAETIRTGVKVSISSETFGRYFSVEEEFSYVRVADAIEEVLKDDSFLLQYNETRVPISLWQIIKEFARFVLCKTKKCLPDEWKVLDKYRNVEETDDYTLQRKINNYASETEILEIQKRIMHVLDLEGRGNERSKI